MDFFTFLCILIHQDISVELTKTCCCYLQPGKKEILVNKLVIWQTTRESLEMSPQYSFLGTASPSVLHV